jgi:hypothetical protein
LMMASAPAASCTSAEVRLTTRRRPSVSTTMWRLQPSSSCPHHSRTGRAKPPLRAPLAVWLSMMAVVGLASRPACSRASTYKA